MLNFVVFLLFLVVLVFIDVYAFVPMFLCGSVGRALRQQCKGCGFDSQGTYVLIKKCIT